MTPVRREELLDYPPRQLTRDGLFYRFAFNVEPDETKYNAGEQQLDERTDARNDYGNLYKLLDGMINRLEPREQIIIRERFGFDAEGGRKATYVSLGKQLGKRNERSL